VGREKRTPGWAIDPFFFPFLPRRAREYGKERRSGRRPSAGFFPFSFPSCRPRAANGAFTPPSASFLFPSLLCRSAPRTRARKIASRRLYFGGDHLFFVKLRGVEAPNGAVPAFFFSWRWRLGDDSALGVLATLGHLPYSFARPWPRLPVLEMVRDSAGLAWPSAFNGFLFLLPFFCCRLRRRLEQEAVSWPGSPPTRSPPDGRGCFFFFFPLSGAVPLAPCKGR